MKIKIKENSVLARIAAKKLKATQVALVLGRTIHLWGVTRSSFLANDGWVRHELAHVFQFQRHGFIKMICLYLLQSLKHGYYNNPFEQQARAAEQVPADHSFIVFI